MIDLVQLQEDVTMALLSDSRLAAVNVIQYRKLRQQSEVDASAIYAKPRQGAQAGAGVLVEMPTMQVTEPNLPGPSGQFLVTCVVMEEPNQNMTAEAGTQIEAENIAQMVLECLHGLMFEGLGSLYSDDRPITPTEEWEGLVAYRVSLRLRLTSDPKQIERVPVPTIQEQALQVTLKAVAGADIYYTTDGSFPGPGNPDATKYQNPFAMQGAVLRWAAYKAGMVGSNVGEAMNNP